MSRFEPFDKEFNFDKSILTEDFPNYMLPSVLSWIKTTLIGHQLFYPARSHDVSDNKLVLPLNRALRKTIRTHWLSFLADIQSDVPTFRNVLTYLLQNVANAEDGRKLETILSDTSSAYCVDFKEEEVREGAFIGKATRMKLVYRVPPVVKEQALDVMRTDQLLAEAWESHYGINPDDEKTVTRCTDALAGLLRDTYFPDEKRPQLGTLLGKMRKDLRKYPLPASSLYDGDKLLELMKDFSKIRGNHKSGTGRAPTHEEASFVLQFTIMLFQLLRSKK